MLAMDKRKPIRDYIKRTLPKSTVEEVLDPFDDEVRRQRRDPNGVEFMGNQLTGIAAMNAIVLYFCSLPNEEKDEIFGKFVPRFEKIMALEDQETQETPTVTAKPTRVPTHATIHPGGSVTHGEEKLRLRRKGGKA